MLNAVISTKNIIFISEEIGANENVGYANMQKIQITSAWRFSKPFQPPLLLLLLLLLFFFFFFFFETGTKFHLIIDKES